jgi:uncharacterized protein
MPFVHQSPKFTAPWWLPGGNAQTIWAALYAKRGGPAPTWQRERWITPDRDFIDVDSSTWPVLPQWQHHGLVLFHGLEGSSASHYAHAFAHECKTLGLRMLVPHFRGCGGELNLAPRAYHSGDWQEIDWILRRASGQWLGVEKSPAPANSVKTLWAVGVSLGGNALMRWAGELGDGAASLAQAVCSVSSPLDLALSGQAIGTGFNRQVYTRMFLRTMKPKALRKLAQHPGLFDRNALLASTDLYQFDNVFTAPLHGFANTEDYWARASAKPHLHNVRTPALCLNALNDPFVPANSLPRVNQVSKFVTLWQPEHGGHVGFPTGAFPANVLGLPQRVLAWMQQSR